MDINKSNCVLGHIEIKINKINLYKERRSKINIYINLLRRRQLFKKNLGDQKVCDFP